MSELALTLALYYAVIISVGLIKLRGQKPLTYITAPNATGPVTLTLTLVATIVGGGMYLGIAQLGFEHGAAAGFALGIVYLLGHVALGALAPRLRRLAKERNSTTLFGILASAYPSERMLSVSNMAAFATFIVFFLMLAVQFTGIATFLSFYLNLHIHTGIMLAAAILAVISIPLYTVFGGFERDMWTDVIQMVVIVAGLGIIAWNIISGGIEAAWGSVGASLGGDKTSVTLLVGGLIFIAPTFLVRFDLWQRLITARSDRTARYAFILSGVFALAFFVAFSYLGAFARAQGAADARFAGLEAIEKGVRSAQGVVIASFFAAVMSSADTFLGVSGLALARLAVYRRKELDTGEVSLVRIRVLTGLVGLVSIGLAFLFRDMLDLFASAFAILMVFLPCVVAALVRKHPGEAEARASVAGGLLATLLVMPFLPRQAFAPGVLVSVLLYLGVYLARRRHQGRFQADETERP